MFETRVTELLGIEYPIIQGGMMWISQPQLAAAVSNAGGLGIITALSSQTPADLTAKIKETKKLTNKSFGVNVTLLPTLKPLDIDGYFDVIVNEDIKIVETAGRNPEAYIAKLKAAGIKVIHKCTAVRFARTAQKIGCDVVSIDGFECAGHPGEDDVTSLILVPLVADAVDVPLIASGGFGDGRGFVAALVLGAEGVNMGTRFMATQESPAHPKVKEWLIQASERDTILINRSLRNTMRALKNPISEKVAEMEKRGTTIEELAPFISGHKGKKLLDTGVLDAGIITAGQIVGLVRDIPTAKDVIDRIIQEAVEVVSRINTKGVFQPFKSK